MNCGKCNKEVTNDMVYCPYCGEKLVNNVIDIVDDEENKNECEQGPWKNFAVTGSVLAKIAICLFWVIGIGTYIGALGIVFSSLGKKSKVNYEMACVAFKRSLIATILSLVFISFISSIIPIIEILIRL